MRLNGNLHFSYLRPVSVTGCRSTAKSLKTRRFSTDGYEKAANRCSSGEGHADTTVTWEQLRYVRPLTNPCTAVL
jgi:hypothetical protein